MSEYVAQINQALKHFAKASGANAEDRILLCTVDSVDEELFLCDCTPLQGGAQINDVRLTGQGSDAGVLFLPAVGSVVGVVMLDASEGFVGLYGEVDKIVMRSGNFGGLVKVESLVDRLNKIEEALQEINQKYNAHTHPSNGAPTTQLLTKTVTSTTRNQIENENIKHG